MKHIYGVYVWERGQVSATMSLWSKPDAAMREAETLSGASSGTRAYVIRWLLDEPNTRVTYVEYVGGSLRFDNRLKLTLHSGA